MQTRRKAAEAIGEHKDKDKEDRVTSTEQPAKRARGRTKKEAAQGKGKGRASHKESNDKEEHEERKEEGLIEPVNAASHEGHKHAKAAASRTIEKGHIYFFYRPKIELEDATSVDEVQKLYLVLRPESGKGSDDRLIVLTKKHLPHITSKTKEKLWGFIDKVSNNMDDIRSRLGPSTYETTTRGTRHLAGAKACGCGVYNIVLHHDEHKSQEHTHMSYVLELPEAPGELQKSFNIAHEASFVVYVKSPYGDNKQNSLDEAKIDYPKPLHDKFSGHKWIPLDDARLLDYEKVQMLFIGATKDDDVATELGECAKDIEAEAEEEERLPIGCLLDPTLFLKELADEPRPTEQIIPTEWPTSSP
jgi:hypothetical protein